jgi:hypothetical protein
MNLLRKLRYIPSFLPETSSYLNAMNQVGSIKMEHLAALDRFIRDCQNSGAWAKVQEVYPLCGSNLAAAMVKLKYVAVQNMTAVNFVDADFASSGFARGITGNGTTKYVDTLFPQSSLGATAHLSAYLRTAESGATARYWIGAQITTTAIQQSIIGTPNGSVAQGMLGGNSNTANSSDIPNPGFYYVERSGPVNLILYRDNALIGSSPASTTPDYGATNLFLWARSAAGVANNHSPQRLSFFSIGQNMTAAERTAFYDAVIRLHNALIATL